MLFFFKLKLYYNLFKSESPILNLKSVTSYIVQVFLNLTTNCLESIYISPESFIRGLGFGFLDVRVFCKHRSKIFKQTVWMIIITLLLFGLAYLVQCKWSVGTNLTIFYIETTLFSTCLSSQWKSLLCIQRIS